MRAEHFPVVDRKLERRMAHLLSQGIDPREAPVDWRKVRENLTAGAVDEVRSSLILSKVAEAEKLEVSEEEIDEVIRAMASEAHEAPATLKTRLTRSGDLDSINLSCRTQKAIDFIYRNAKITRKSQ